MFKKDSYFVDSKMSASAHTPLPLPTPERVSSHDDYAAQIRSWAADLSDCINALGRGDVKGDVKVYARAIDRLDDLVREMDAYESRLR